MTQGRTGNRFRFQEKTSNMREVLLRISRNSTGFAGKMVTHYCGLDAIAREPA